MSWAATGQAWVALRRPRGSCGTPRPPLRARSCPQQRRQRRTWSDTMGLTILAGLILLLIVFGTLAYLTTIYNSLVRLRNDIDKAWANIDVLLKQRHDELPKLIETCLVYVKYEQKTLELVVEARNAYQRAGSVPEKSIADTILIGGRKTLTAVG